MEVNYLTCVVWLMISWTYVLPQGIVPLGNNIVGTDVSSTNNGTIYLFDDVAVQNGILFGFSAFFLNRNPVVLQVWRPLTSGPKSYQLMKQWTWIPNVLHGREDVYLHLLQGSTCYKVQSSDKLGIYQPTASGSVAYRFSTSSPQSLTLLSRWQNTNTPPAIGAEVTFDSLVYPYKFSLKAWVDTDMSKYSSSANPDCPTTLFIPDSGIVYSPKYGGPTGQMGATGGTGLRGPMGQAGSDGSQGATGQRGPLGAFGATGNTGSIGGTGHTGPEGRLGYTGSTGPIGATGMSGSQGVKGDKGDTGPAGAVGVNPLAQKYESCPWCEKFMDAYVIMGLMVWLGVLTLIFFIYAFVNCCCKGAKNTRHPSQDDLWRKYEKPGYENHYSEVEEGRTTF